MSVSPEAESIFADARGGLLEDEQLDILRYGVKRWELNYQKQDAQSIARYAKLEEEEDAAEKEWSEVGKALKGVEVSTELEEGVPAKLVQPFTMKPGGNVIEMSAMLKLTEDRPGVKDRLFHKSDYYYIKMVAIDADGEPIDTINVWSPVSHNVERSFSAGEEIEVRTGIDVRNFEKSRSILIAKKLRIIWEHFMQEKISETVHGDLGIFNLRGPVEVCKWKGLYDTWTLYFDTEGKWTKEEGRGTFNVFPQTTRDAQGRITELSNGDERLVYEYNADGLLKKHIAQYMDGGTESVYEYDANGDCSKETSIYGGLDMEEDEGPTVSIYTILERDEHGNWTQRKDQNGNVERRTIKYYDF